MRDVQPLSALSEAYHSAILRDLPGSKVMNPLGGPLILRPAVNEVDVTHFRQIWNSTGLGLPNAGEAFLTYAYTSVISHRSNHAVYFDGKLAYVLESPDQRFYEDLERRVLRPIRQVHYYKRKA